MIPKKMKMKNRKSITLARPGMDRNRDKTIRLKDWIYFMLFSGRSIRKVRNAETLSI